MKPEELSRWVQEATAGQLAAFLGLASARLVVLLGQAGAPPISNSPAKLLDAGEVAARLHLSKRWVYETADRLPFARRIGRSVRFDATGLERWVQEQQQAAQ